MRKLRNEKRISARSLSKGICAASAIANYERGERVCDAILLERFLERMGIVSSNFALMLQEAEVGVRLVGNKKNQNNPFLKKL